MKLGLLTAPFPRRSLKQVAAWAVERGLRDARGRVLARSRRRATPVRRDVAHRRRRASTSGAVRDVLDRHGLEISSLAFYPNNLHPDPAERRAANTHLRKVIDAAAKLDVGIVGTFVGRDKTKNVPDNFREFRKVWPRLVDYAEARGVKIAIENCPMIFSWDEWPGGTNLASSPAIWDEMFSIVDSPSFGLNLDPSHLVWLQIDYERVVRDYASKLFHVHAKDMEIDRDGLYRNGTASLGMGWQVPRLPGLGEVRWDRFVAALYRAGYDFVVSVEHEDRAFEATEELVKRGFLIARDALKPLLALGALGSLLLPFGSEQRVLHVAFLLALDVVGPGLVEDPHEPQPRLLQHAARRDVHDHGERHDAFDAELGEALVDERSRAFGRVSLPPRGPVQAVAELHLVRTRGVRRPEVEPARGTDRSTSRSRPRSRTRRSGCSSRGTPAGRRSRSRLGVSPDRRSRSASRPGRRRARRGGRRRAP